jgi:RHS repeat-associated protein
MTMTGPLSAKVVAVSEIDSSRMRSVADALGRTTSYEYTGNRLSKVKMPEGNEVRYTHDLRGNVTETRLRDKAGNSANDIVTSASFDGACANPKICNKPVTTTDARNATTEYTYDGGHGGVRTVTAPAAAPGAVRPQTRIEYLPFQARYQNSPGNIVASGSAISLPVSVSACKTQASCAGTADEARTTISYDPQNGGGPNNLLPVSTSSGDGTAAPRATSTMTYDAVGNLLTVDGPLDGTGDTSRTRFDAVRRPVGSVSPDPDGTGPLKHRASRVMRNSDGQVSKVESGTVESQSDAHWNSFNPVDAVETGYDPLGRPVVQKLTAGGTTYALTQTNYDLLGRPDCTAQRMNREIFATVTITTGACVVGGRPSNSEDFGPDRITQTEYDELGRVKKAWSAVGTGDPAAEAAYTYHPNGQVHTLTDGEGNRTTYTFDGHDRLSRTEFPVAAKGAKASNPDDFEELGYDAAGNITSRRVRDGQVIRYEYNALNRLTYKNLPNTAVYENDSGFGYDLLGRMVVAGDGMGHQTSFGYDSLGRRVSESSNWYGTTSSEYDLAGRRTRLTWRDGFSVTYEHHATGEMKAVRENSGFLLASFSYDDWGNRIKLTRGNGTVTDYKPDAVSRLEMLKQTFPASAANTLTLDFTHNPAGQIASNTRSNDLFSWTGSAAGTTGWEANGLNQVAKQDGVQFSYDLKGNLLSDGTRSYSYTAENRLASGASTNIYYDALGRLVHLTSGINFHYHGGEFIETQSASGATRRYVHGPGTDEPLVWYEGAGTNDRRYLHADERGSIVAVSDDTGNAIGINKYDEYGNPAATNVGSFGYTGQVWLPELGLWHYKERMYDPRLGRFLQPDPIGYEDGPNMYGYVGGDPVNLNDPEGLGERCITTGSLICRPKDGHPGDPICGSCSGGSTATGGVPGGGRNGLDGGWSRVCIKNCGRSQTVFDSNGNVAEIIVRAPVYEWVPNSLSFFVQDGRYILNPNFRKSPYSDAFDTGVGLMFGGPVLVMGAVETVPAAGAAIAARMAHTRTFGFASSRFGNTFHLGRQGSWNYGGFRIGWSFNKGTGMMGFQIRIGRYHLPTPFQTTP